MNKLLLSVFGVLLLALSLVLTGCGGAESTDDPNHDICTDEEKCDSPNAAAGVRISTLTEAEGRGLLRVANEVSRADLANKAKVGTRVAANIDKHRLGSDGIAGTEDDDPFDTLNELDGVSYVGAVAFDKLLAYAMRLGWVEEQGPGHQLDGFDETLLVASSEGQLAVLKVGNTFSRTMIDVSATPPNVIRSHGGKFFLLYDDGKLVVVDPDQAVIDKTIDLPVSEPGDLEWATETSIYVSSKNAGAIIKVDLQSGESSSIDLASLQIAGGEIQPRRLLHLGDHLFVQVARTRVNGKPDRGALAVVNTTQDVIEKVIELEAQDPRSGEMVAGLEPDLPIAWDSKRNKLFVTLTGIRPSNTGMIMRIDPEALAVYDVKMASSGFQGAVAFGAPFSNLFIIYHTSTPTTSSHLFVYLVDEDGKLTPAGGGTLVDTFDGLDALAINSSGSLVTMANTCVTGFCTHGAGLNFVDTATRAVLPKLLADQIGFEPLMVQFK